MSDVMAGDEQAAAPNRRSVAYSRPKKTKASVIFADKAADRIITVGGLVVIGAVFAIMLFLISVAMPVFDGGKLLGRKDYAIPADHPIVSARMDEHQTVAADIAADGSVSLFHVPTGRVLAPAPGPGGGDATAFARGLKGDDVAFGYSDGTVRLGRSVLRQMVVSASAVPEGLERLDARDRTDGRAVFSDVPGNQVRRTMLQQSLEAPVKVNETGAAIRFLDYRVAGTAERPTRAFVTVDEAGETKLNFADSRVNMMTGETETALSSALLPATVPASEISAVLLNSAADRVLIAGKDGRIFRIDVRDMAAPRVAETVRVLPEGTAITALAFLNGENSLVVGGADGSISVWFGVDRKSPQTADGIVLTKVHVFDKAPAAINHIAVSQRTRLFATADSAGGVRLHHATTTRTLIQFETGHGQELAALLLGPRDDAILAVGKAGKAVLWSLAVPHPETTLESLFGKIWYEGYGEPAYVWQSTSGTDSFEPKLSLVPLIFGTFKAATYSLLFAIPIALLAAIYTSEFMPAKTRAVVKPVMELMASLPSVVIGFVAALVLSPIVENAIAAVVMAFLIVPLALILAAYLWQLIPLSVALPLQGGRKLIFFALVVGAALWASASSGPLIERLLFGGDFKAWTAGSGPPDNFIFLLMVPVSFLITFALANRIAGPWLQAKTRSMKPLQAASIDLLRFAVLAAVSFLIAYLLAGLLAGGVDYDPRGGVIGTYVQRNTLIAAFAIAFAGIPIIYTIAEDAMNSVPEHLRGASLGCGATPWQTARYVILPTAGSGIFSAVMIGFGRAVGETMIVVMATGNTPVTDWNLFNGLRALSANINVELPEAVRDSTLYRTLFLCGLVLFIVTFILNTVAEMVRQRFRKRAAQL